MSSVAEGPIKMKSELTTEFAMQFIFKAANVKYIYDRDDWSFYYSNKFKRCKLFVYYITKNGKVTKRACCHFSLV